MCLFYHGRVGVLGVKREPEDPRDLKGPGPHVSYRLTFLRIGSTREDVPM